MRISDWSSDVCSSDLPTRPRRGCRDLGLARGGTSRARGRRPARRAVPALAAVPVDHPATRHAGSLGRGVLTERGQSGAAQLGRESCRENVCHYVEISVVTVSLKKKTNNNKIIT